jgi:hypothetical protein
MFERMLPDYFVVPQRDTVLLHHPSDYSQDLVLSMSMWDEEEDDYKVNK